MLLLLTRFERNIMPNRNLKNVIPSPLALAIILSFVVYFLALVIKMMGGLATVAVLYLF